MDKKLEKIGICVVLIFHKSDNATPTNPDRTIGSQLFKKPARTIINLTGKKEILGYKLGTEITKQYAVQNGLTIGMEFTTCKNAPILEDKTFWLHLPVGSNEWNILSITNLLGNEINSPCLNKEENHPKVDKTTVGEGGSEVPSTRLSPNQKKVLATLREVGGEAKIGELTKKLEGTKGLKEDSIRKKLKELGALGYVGSNGQGSGTYYFVFEDIPGR